MCNTKQILLKYKVKQFGDAFFAQQFFWKTLSPVPSLALCSGGNRHQHSYHLLPRFPGLLFVVNFSNNNPCLSHCIVPKKQDDLFQRWQLLQQYHVSSLTICHCSRWHLPLSHFFPNYVTNCLAGTSSTGVHFFLFLPWRVMLYE